jgi:hypothetical protein
MLDLKMALHVVEPQIKIPNQISHYRRLTIMVGDPETQEGVSGHLDFDISKLTPDLFLANLQEAAGKLLESLQEQRRLKFQAEQNGKLVEMS